VIRDCFYEHRFCVGTRIKRKRPITVCELLRRIEIGFTVGHWYTMFHPVIFNEY